MKGEASKTFSMTGHVSAAPSAKGTTVVYVWDVVDPSGEHKTRITGDETIPGAGFNDPWNAVDDSAMQRIASRTAEELSSFISKMGYEVKLASVPPPAAMLSDTADSIQTADITGNPADAQADPVVTGTVAPANSGTAQAQPEKAAAPQRTASVAKPAAKGTTKKAKAKTKAKKKAAKANAIAVPMVVGAKGRGNQELAAAMRKAMSRAGVPIVKKQRKGAITVCRRSQTRPAGWICSNGVAQLESDRSYWRRYRHDRAEEPGTSRQSGLWLGKLGRICGQCGRRRYLQTTEPHSIALLQYFPLTNRHN